MLNKKGIVLCGLTSLIALSAMADTTPVAPASATEAVGTTTSATTDVAPSILEKLTASYVNVFYGPSLADPGSLKQPDPDSGVPTDALMMKNYLALGYKATENVTIAPTLYFRVNNSGENMLQMQDPYLRTSHGKAINVGNLNVSADIRLAPGISPGSRALSKIGYVGSKQVSTYTIPNSKASIVLTTQAYANMFSGETLLKKGVRTQRFVELYAGPAVEYQLLPNLAFGVLYERATVNFRGDGLSGWSDDGQDVEPYVSWDITPAINFNPWLDFKTGNTVSMSTTTIGAALTWKLL